VLDHDEAADVAEQFGVAFEQVRRDHLISHLLAALSATLSDRWRCDTPTSAASPPTARLRPVEPTRRVRLRGERRTVI
jgi:hypothetical protein